MMFLRQKRKSIARKAYQYSTCIVCKNNMLVAVSRPEKTNTATQPTTTHIGALVPLILQQMARALLIAKGVHQMANGTLFMIIVIVFFVVFATQAGSRESKIHLGFGGWMFLLVVVGGILWALWSGTGVAFLH
jgi:hypothetical protein